MSLQTLYDEIQKFNNGNQDSNKNVVNSNKEYRGNQHDLDTFNNTIQYIEYKKNLRKEKLTIRKVEAKTYDSYESVQQAIENSQYKKIWSKLDTYCKKVKISEYIENEVEEGRISRHLKKECIAHIFRLLEQKKLNKKGNIEYDSENGVITSISETLFSGILNA